MQRHTLRHCWHLVVLTILAALSGCSSHTLKWTGENVARGTIDSLLGFPVFTVFTGAGDALTAGNEKEHEQNVEELNNAYAEFLEQDSDEEQACCLNTFRR